MLARARARSKRLCRPRRGRVRSADVEDVGDVPMVVGPAIAVPPFPAVARPHRTHKILAAAKALPLVIFRAVGEEVRRASAGSSIPCLPRNLPLDQHANLEPLDGHLRQQRLYTLGLQSQGGDHDHEVRAHAIPPLQHQLQHVHQQPAALPEVRRRCRGPLLHFFPGRDVRRVRDQQVKVRVGLQQRRGVASLTAPLHLSSAGPPDRGAEAVGTAVLLRCRVHVHQRYR
mmetsp:Transcript_1658/g.6525  ORF Transcript_1658/g.6525 Transcript_1658/m.6525 type:complete len:229 (-) Transcript_1658:628-1314(-)